MSYIYLTGNEGNVYIQDGDIAYLYGGAKTSDIMIEQGGVLYVVDDGPEPVIAGTITVKGQVDAHGYVSEHKNFKVVWDLTDGNIPNSPMICDMEYLATMYFSILVSNDQPEGTYFLANGLVDLPKGFYFPIKVQDGKSSKITINKPITLAGQQYILNLAHHDLTLTVSSTSALIPEPSSPEEWDVDVKKYDTTVAWEKITAPKGVKVSYQVRVDWDDDKIYKTNTNKYTLKNASIGEHIFEVRTIFTDKTGASKTSDWSEGIGVDISDVTAPKTGALKKVEQTGDDTVLVEWTEATDNVGIDRYVVTCGSKDIEEIEVYPGEDLSYEFSGMAGKVTVTLTPYDEAGNPGKTVKKTITMKDVTPPDQVTGLDHDEVNSKSGGTLCWNESDDNEGVTQYLITVEDEKGKKSSYTSKTNSLKLKKLNVGNYKFTVVAVDKAKNKSDVSEICEFKVTDGIDPKIKKLSAKVNKDNSATVTWNATDETKFGYVELALDDEAPQVFTNESGSLMLPELSAGQHTLHMTAYDDAGNDAKKTINFKIKGNLASLS